MIVTGDYPPRRRRGGVMWGLEWICADKAEKKLKNKFFGFLIISKLCLINNILTHGLGLRLERKRAGVRYSSPYAHLVLLLLWN